MAGAVTKKEKDSKPEGNKVVKRKEPTRQHGALTPKEEALKQKRLAEEEAERQRAAAAAEEARLAALKDEEQRLKRRTSVTLLNDEERRKDLVAWVKSVPLSDGCSDRIDRDFSDGSLLAEVIHYYCPRICDNRQYFRWNSKVNKVSNWEALNHKVFPKLGFRLNQKQINNLLNPYICGKYQKDCEQGLFIYKLLHKIRKELAGLNPSVFDYRKSNFVPPQCERKPKERKFVNFLEHPPFSKVEMLLEQGFYDDNLRPGAAKEVTAPKCACSSKSESCFPTFLPCSFPTNGCFNLYESGLDCNENGTCVQPALSFKLAQPVASCFFC